MQYVCSQSSQFPYVRSYCTHSMEVCMKDVAERVDELEVRFSYQENMIQELSGVIFSQQKELEALQAEVKTLRTKLKDFEHSAAEGSQEKPPHY